MAFKQIEIDCSCGRLVNVDDIETTLQNEDFRPIEVTCQCGERYRVSLRMEILGKVQRRPLIRHE